MTHLFKAGVFSALLLIAWAPAALAGGTAYGKADAVIGCAFDPVDGLVVDFVDTGSGDTMGILPGDRCLDIVAAFPPPFTREQPVPMAKTKPGTAVDAPDCLIWIFDGPNVSSGTEILGCDPDGHGGLMASFVDSSAEGFSRPVGQMCLGTLASRAGSASLVTGPVPVSLGTGSEPCIGCTVTWTYRVENTGAVGVLGCAFDEERELVVAFQDTSDGMVDDMVGQSCAAAVDEPGLPGVTIYSDLNANGFNTQTGLLVFDIGKPSAHD